MSGFGYRPFFVCGSPNPDGAERSTFPAVLSRYDSQRNADLGELAAEAACDLTADMIPVLIME